MSEAPRVHFFSPSPWTVAEFLVLLSQTQHIFECPNSSKIKGLGNRTLKNETLDPEQNVRI